MADSTGTSAKPELPVSAEDKPEAKGVAARSAVDIPGTPAVEEYPDPDEDDLDDLDDILPEFSAVKIEETRPSATTTAPSQGSNSAVPPVTEGGNDPNPSDEDLQAQLEEKLLASLLGEESMPGMEAQFHEMFKKIAEAAGEAADAEGSLPASERATAAGPNAFQDKIRETMARMETGGKQATEAAVNDGSDDFMAELLKQMGGAGFGEGGEDFDKLLTGMMEQLVTKEILYQPMKDLDGQFPPWLEKNKEKVSKEDMERYTKQQAIVGEIVAKFEEPTYSDSNEADRSYISAKMEEMQACGSPPPDLLVDSGNVPDFSSMPDDGCAPQ